MEYLFVFFTCIILFIYLLQFSYLFQFFLYFTSCTLNIFQEYTFLIKIEFLFIMWQIKKICCFLWKVQFCIFSHSLSLSLSIKKKKKKISLFLLMFAEWNCSTDHIINQTHITINKYTPLFLTFYLIFCHRYPCKKSEKQVQEKMALFVIRRL